MSVKKKSDGVFEVRWREGGETKACACAEAISSQRRSSERRCRHVMKTGISM